MSRRIKYHMPSTTNSLEATHGHLNAITPRRNSLFASIFRIHNEMNSKFLNINQRIQHNYNYTKRKTSEKVKNINHETFEFMCIHYSTSKKFCLCSENKLVSSNLKIDIPCSHRLSKGETFPDLPKINLNLIHQYSNLEIIHEFVPAEKTQEDEKTDEMKYIVKGGVCQNYRSLN